MKITLLTIGRLKGAYAELCDEYVKRLTMPFAIKELAASNKAAESQALLNLCKGLIVLLDERGPDQTSRAFAQQLSQWQDQSIKDLVFIIGGADGVTEELKNKANHLLSLGQKTWPHKLARVMFLEQLYRAQQINAKHPYHRD
ncbi:MAG: 23S rRNA (pseudouridine(1915)-N(3))-methyltransferase RlmH [Alphaproteobacteria bacterium]|nr:23S rRNA (pseudouridine(1915)-N(3))-methyltransferase RlmH [Alphaproteobacteria bacterium]